METKTNFSNENKEVETILNSPNGYKYTDKVKDNSGKP